MISLGLLGVWLGRSGSIGGDHSTDPALLLFGLELAKGVLPVLEETTDPALLLFGLEKPKGVLEDRASFLLILDPATWWVVLVPLVEILE